MVRKILSGVLLVAVGLTSVLTLSDRDDNAVLVEEKRMKTPLPKFPKKLRRKEYKEFGDAMERYFLDRIVCRDMWMDIASLMPAHCGDTDIYVQGRDGWLFLGNKTNKYVDRVTGRDVATEADVQKVLAPVLQARDMVERCGAEFHVMVGPNKANVYPEYWPSLLQRAQERYAAKMIQAVRQNGVDLFDPLDLLLANKDKGLLYWRTDTHWNQHGSYMATKAFVEHCSLARMPECKTAQAPLYRGDLLVLSGRRDLRPSAGDNMTLEWEVETPTSLSDKKILLMGDSFSMMPHQILKLFFKDVVYLDEHLTTPGEAYLDALGRYLAETPNKPDVVLWIMVERHFADGHFAGPPACGTTAVPCPALTSSPL